MKEKDLYQIITFYEFKDLGDGETLKEIKKSLDAAMRANSILGTIILAREGFNSTVSGTPRDIEKFTIDAERILETRLKYKSSFHAEQSFRRIKVKIKPEIVTLKEPEIVTLKEKVKIEKAAGTHAAVSDWNKIINDPETIVLDARNDYEFRVGTFKNAVNPRIEKFSDLPRFVRENLNPQKHKKIAMFCTGGIRCEKLAPFLIESGFETVYQLSGGILKYLEETPENESLWAGECFVFDERTMVDENLKKGNGKDLSAATKSRANKK